jgi:hypothetical protein
MNQREGRVILVGTLAPWEHPKEDGDVIWCINQGYKHQPNLDRLYVMDPITTCIQAWGWDAVDEINALGVPVVMREVCDFIPNSQPFTWEGSFQNFSISFYGSTTSNAISNAIEEGFAEIILHKMFLRELSEDYFHHKASVGFWVGQAISNGLKVTVDPESFLDQVVIDKLKGAMEMRNYRKSAGLEVETLDPPPLLDMVLHVQKRQQERKAAGV